MGIWFLDGCQIAIYAIIMIIIALSAKVHDLKHNIGLKLGLPYNNCLSSYTYIISATDHMHMCMIMTCKTNARSNKYIYRDAGYCNQLM